MQLQTPQGQQIAAQLSQALTALGDLDKVCGQPRGHRCEEIAADDVEREPSGALKMRAEAKALTESGEKWVYPKTRIVPHEARLR